MRKIMMIPLCLLLMLSLLTGCRSGNTTPPVDDTPTPTTEPTPTDPQTSQDPHVASLQESMGENGCLLAVAYLGSADVQYPEFTAGVERSGYPEKMPFLLDVPEENTAFRAGMELYALIPAAGVSLQVYAYDMDETGNCVRGEELLYTPGNEVLVVRGNISDIIPNLLVVAKNQAGMEMEYSPYISLRDGKLAGGEGIWDISDYDLAWEAGW